MQGIIINEINEYFDLQLFFSLPWSKDHGNGGFQLFSPYPCPKGHGIHLKSPAGDKILREKLHYPIESFRIFE